jgi:hypothetical protein
MPNYSFDEKEHLHTLGNLPLYGTTTVLSIIGKGGLNWWASGMAVGEFGWLNPKKHTSEERINQAWEILRQLKILTPEAYLQLLDKAYRAHDTRKKDRAEEGINIHELCEKFIKNVMERNFPHVSIPKENMQLFDVILPFMRWCDKNVKQFLFSELHCYSKKLFVGGICDFAFIDKADNYVLADIKSRDKVYFGDFVQMGAYHTQIEENGGYTPEGEKIFTLDKPFKYHAVFPVGENFKEPVINERTVWAQKAFENALNLYKAKEEWEGSYDIK